MAVTTYKKARLGRQDLLFDNSGNDAEITVPTSDGNTRNVEKINAGHVPTTLATRAKKTADDTVSAAVDVDGSLQELYDDVNAIGIPDGVTLVVVAGVLKVGAIDAPELGAGSVTTIEILDGTILTVDMSDDSIDNDKLKDDVSVDANRAVTTNHIRDVAITTPKVADDAITKDKLNNGQFKRLYTARIENLGAGVDIADRAEFLTPSEGATMAKIGVIAQGASSAGVGAGDPITIVIKNATQANTIVTKIFTSNLVADAFNNLGVLSNTGLSGNDVITVSVTQGASADAPILLITFEYEQTDA